MYACVGYSSARVCDGVFFSHLIGDDQMTWKERATHVYGSGMSKNSD